ncbi:MAG: AMP-binding protein [Pseudomonadota bacterium]|nr:AMP-binding protein [Pseudomonadota bacterium]MDP1903293.1 AMP-binding protein [Pseudomonadota bacterium]MDP2353383.1 AMP-binding protein [Pseudomonadota bacterium]
MSLYTRLVSGLIFPWQERLKRHDSTRVRRQMEASQYWPLERLERLRLERLQALLSHAGQHVPYYRELFSRLGFDPSGVAATSDLQRLPFLDKATIRAQGDALKSEQARDLARFNTGGSTGEPLIFFIGGERVSHDVAAKWRATRWWGVDIGDPEVVLWGSLIELTSQDRVRQFRDALMRTKLLPAFEMSPEKVAGFIAEIRAMRPKMLFGYPSAFAHIARHAEEHGIRLDDLGIKVAFVTSERLYPHQRELIERVFACPVANGYGGRDAGFIAHQCPAGGMHLTHEDLIVEIVDAAGRVLPPGESGEIVVTHLATRDFPFIRYRTGDIGVLGDSPCACGRTLPLLKEIEGRSTDFLVARDGTVMHGLSLIYIVRDLPGVRQFKIIQESLDQTRIQLLTDAAFDPACLAGIEAGAKARLGADVRVLVELVETIPPEKSGKYRYVVSRVDPNAPEPR